MRPSLRPLLPLTLVLAVLASACGSSQPGSPTAQSGSPASGSPGPTATPRLSGTPALTGQPVPNTQENIWCPVGTYSQTQTGAGTIEGIVEFKGGTYCKIVSTTSSSGITVTHTYYYNFGSTDTWSVMDINGQVTETHIVNGAVVFQTTPEPFAGIEWCASGMELPATGGIVFGRLEGIVEFKGEEFCKAVRTQTVNGQTIIYTYYFKQDNSDVWMVTDANGNIIETHVVGG